MQINRVEIGKCFIRPLAAHIINLRVKIWGMVALLFSCTNYNYILFQNQILFGQKFVQTELLKVQ